MIFYLYAALTTVFDMSKEGIIYSLLDKKREADEQIEIYHNLIPEEYLQRGFINYVIPAAKQSLQSSYRKILNLSSHTQSKSILSIINRSLLQVLK